MAKVKVKKSSFAKASEDKSVKSVKSVKPAKVKTPKVEKKTEAPEE